MLENKMFPENKNKTFNIIITFFTDNILKKIFEKNNNYL